MENTGSWGNVVKMTLTLDDETEVYFDIRAIRSKTLSEVKNRPKGEIVVIQDKIPGHASVPCDNADIDIMFWFTRDEVEG